MKEKSTVEPCEVTIFPMTQFEAYMTMTSGILFHKLSDNEEEETLDEYM
jgi:hypothetical protein